MRGVARGGRGIQRIGLSATQRPLEEIARLLAGADAEAAPDAAPRQRPVEIIDASEPKRLDLRIETPVEDMAELSQPLEIPSGPTAGGPVSASIWPHIHPRLVELIREHRSTMIFVNSRRLAERLAAAVNELAGEEIAQAHHGSIARAKRVEIEDRLKRGQLPAIVATSSLELGIDMGAVDLVIQIEAPPSVASGMQRIGRAGHHVGAPSEGVIFPKYRGDLLACSAATQRMLRGEVESTRYPRNPLDVLAQQIVAMVALEPMAVDELYATVRGAAPFFELPRSLFDGVLDMLSGRYPSDEFAELRPRVTWDRLTGMVSGRKASQRLAVLNGGTIPDRGLYGVFLAGEAGAPGTRVGELDEEMVFETHAGDVFLLGASSWRVLEIDRDRVLVAPAPGEPGKMPFWRGDGPGRPIDFGRAIGALSRRLARASHDEATALLESESKLDARACENLYRYVCDQAEATGELPSDECIVIESFIDELGDWRTVVLSPFGSRVHAPWAIAAAARLRAETGHEVDFTWADDGIVFRVPESDRPPAVELLLPPSQEIEDAGRAGVGFHGHVCCTLPRERGAWRCFCRGAARSIARPCGCSGGRARTCLPWRRGTSGFRSCWRLIASACATCSMCRDCESCWPTSSGRKFACTRWRRAHPRRSRRRCCSATPAVSCTRATPRWPNGEPRRWRWTTRSFASCWGRPTTASCSMRMRSMRSRWNCSGLDRPAATGTDAIHDLLLHLGDLSDEELAARADGESVASGVLAAWIEELVATRRIVRVRIAGERRLAAAEDAARLRDALGVALPPGLPEAFLETGVDPLGDLVSRYARTHGPFRTADVAARFGLGDAAVLPALERLTQGGRILSGEFLPGGVGREWCDAAVLRRIKSRSLALVRKQIEPAPPESLARLLPAWQGVERPRRGLDGLLDAIELLQGAPLLASDLDSLILPARVADYRLSDLDELCTAGEVAWRGIESVGPSDGRIALYLADNVPLLAPSPAAIDDPLAERIHDLLEVRGAVFFEEIARELGGFRNDVLDALWKLVWAGHVTNDTLAPVRGRRRGGGAAEGLVTPRSRSRRRDRRQFRSRRPARIPGAEGRWSLVDYQGTNAARDGEPARSLTERQTALTEQLIRRYGVLVRSAVGREAVEGGFSALYPILRAMEDAGRVRRGYFVAGMGGAQFAAPGPTSCCAAAARERTIRTSPSSCWPRVIRQMRTAPSSNGQPRASMACNCSAAAGRASSCTKAVCWGILAGRVTTCSHSRRTIPPVSLLKWRSWPRRSAQSRGAVRRCWWGRSTARRRALLHLPRT